MSASASSGSSTAFRPRNGERGPAAPAVRAAERHRGAAALVKRDVLGSNVVAVERARESTSTPAGAKPSAMKDVKSPSS